MKITVCAYLKNAHKLKNPSYYARVKVDGRTHDIPLRTTEKSVAESWVRLRRSEIQRYNDYIACGEQPPEDLLAKLNIGSNKPSKGSVELIKALDEWETELRRRGFRERSIDTYCKGVRATIPQGATTEDFTRANIRIWLSKHDHLRPSTRKSYSVSLHEFCKHLIAEHGLDSRLLQEWPRVIVEPVSKNSWTMAQMYHIIEAVKCTDKVMEEQFKVYAWIMASCGSRQVETYELTWNDFHDNCLTFRAETTKGRKERTVPLDIRVAEMLLRMPRHGAKIFSAIPKSQAGRYAILERAVKAVNAPHGGLHTFRTSVSRILYRKCKDITAVAALLGHSPEVSMMHYSEARKAEELRTLVDNAYSDETMIPSTIDELIKNGLW